MTDAELIYWILLFFYLYECTFWVQSGSFAVVSQVGECHRRTGLRWAFLRNLEGGVLLGNILPTGHSSLTQGVPFSVSPEGVYAYSAFALDPDQRVGHLEKFARFEDIDRFSSQGEWLLVNGAKFARCVTVQQARRQARKLRELKGLPVEKRTEFIDTWLSQHLDGEEVRSRYHLFRRSTRDLQITGCLLFFLVFLAPIIVTYVNPYVLILPFLAGYVAFVLLAQLQFRAAAVRLIPDDVWGRRKQMLTMLFSPADAIHARDRLGRELFGEYHPLAVTWALGKHDDFVELAQHTWRDANFPIQPPCPTDAGGPAGTEAWFRERMVMALKKFLDEHGIDAETTLQPPQPETVRCLHFCPRCRGQFERKLGDCHECRQPLLPIA